MIAANLRVTRSMSLSLRASVCVAAMLLLMGEGAAEIVIDDFVDAVEIALPQEKDVWKFTNPAGDLGANRSVRVRASRTEPNGLFDIDISNESALTVLMPSTDHTIIEPTLALNLVYDFEMPVELTQGGLNDAVILKFDRLTADIELPEIQVSATQLYFVGSIGSTSRYTSTYSPAPQNTGPFSLVFPFESFRPDRGGSPPKGFDFSAVVRLDVLLTLALIDPNLPEQLDFEMRLNSVRVGQIIPEPSAISSLLWIAVVMWCHRSRRQF